MTQAVPARPAPVPRLRRRWLANTGVYVLLTIMVGADAYGFWMTLTRLIRRDTELVLFFVCALAVGSVAASHQLGKLARSRMAGYGGSLFWMGFIALLWLGLGSTIAWMRAQDDLGDRAPRATGVLAPSATPSSDEGSVQIAVLLLVLYLLTGAIAMTHAYVTGDPRSAEIRAAHDRREQLARQLAEQRLESEIHHSQQQVHLANIERERQARDRENELNDAYFDQMRNQFHQRLAAHFGDAAATDGLMTDQDDKTRRRPGDPDSDEVPEI